MPEIPKMPIPTAEQQRHFMDLSLAVGGAEAALDAHMQILRHGKSVSDITRTFPETKRLLANLQSALSDLMEAAYHGEGLLVGPLHAARSTETRIKEKIASTTKFMETYGNDSASS